MTFYNYKCKYCAQTFMQQSVLIRHEISHTGEKPFECSICEKRYTRKFTLNNHMKVHYGIYDHVCYICKKSFTDKSNMNAHMKTHTNDRPYSCDICEKTFKRKYDVTKHKREQKQPCAKQSQLKKVTTLKEENQPQKNAETEAQKERRIRSLVTQNLSEPESDIEEIADNYDIKANENPKAIDKSNMANEELLRNNYLNNLRLYCFLAYIFRGIIQCPNENL